MIGFFNNFDLTSQILIRFLRVFTPKSSVRKPLNIQINSYAHIELHMNLSIILSRIICFP